MPVCGLLGEKLSHSYSPRIHSLLGSYEYNLYEKSPDEVEDFIINGSWDAINVTIPYKKTAALRCDVLSEAAKSLGSANTLIRRNGKIYGYNTDFFGFNSMVAKSGINVKGKKALVLGSGGASVTVCAVLKELGANVVVISRNGENNYFNLSRHSDADVIVNATPVGMYPKNGASPVDLGAFPRLCAVFDLIYNPQRTALMMQAQCMGIPCMNGLHMLVAQAKLSSELFLDTVLPDEIIGSIEKELQKDMQNIILIGMPGSGKSEISRRLSKALGRSVVEADALIAKKAGMSISEIFKKHGESYFRSLETQILSDACRSSGQIISTGGGCVTKEENYPILHQNGVIIRLIRDVSSLPTDSRPLSKSVGVAELALKREPMYKRFADFEVDNNGDPDLTVANILDLLENGVL